MVVDEARRVPEICHAIQHLHRYGLRAKSGRKVDRGVALSGRLMPIEVKWTGILTVANARYMSISMHKSSTQALRGGARGDGPSPLELAEKGTARPWL